MFKTKNSTSRVIECAIFFIGYCICSGGTLAMEVTTVFPKPEVTIVSQKLLTQKPVVGSTCEITLNLSEQFNDSYNPSVVQVDAEIATPSRTYSVPGFFYQAYIQGEDGKILKTGKPEWRVRFLPIEPGKHQVTLSVTANGGGSSVPALVVPVQNKDWHGLVRVSKYNSKLLMYENGDPVHLRGFNVFGTIIKNFTALPDTWIDKDAERIKKLAAHGGNCIRLRMDGWWYTIESTPRADLGYEGLGKYNQRACWDIDRLFSLCENNDINILLCLNNAHALVNDNHFSFVDNQSYHFFNKENGGILDENDDFWMDMRAREFYKQKIRYVVARWGASPSLAVWEYMNELKASENLWDSMTDWLAEMGDEFKKVDPFYRLLTFSICGAVGSDAPMWKVKNLDITHEHLYGDPMYDFCKEYLDLFDKPFIAGEVGSGLMKDYYFEDGAGPYVKQDTEAVVTHIRHWISAFALSSGAFNWFQMYDDNENYWTDFSRLENCLREIPFRDRSLVSDGINVYQAPGAKLADPQDLVLRGGLAWKKAAENQFTVLNNGDCAPSAGHLSMLWGNKAHSDMKNPPVFTVSHTSPWRFGLRVSKVYNELDTDSSIRFTLDGSQTTELTVPTDATGETFFAEIPAGKHTVSVEYLGVDRMEVSYVFENYLTEEITPPLEGIQISHSKGFDLYILNGTWNEKALMGIEKHIPAKNVSVKIDCPQDGTVKAEFINPLTGEITKTENLQIQKKALKVQFGDLDYDIYCRIRYY